MVAFRGLPASVTRPLRTRPAAGGWLHARVPFTAARLCSTAAASAPEAVSAALATRNPNMTPISKELAHDWLAPIVRQRSYVDAELAGPRPAWWWTGKAPEHCPGWDAATSSLHSTALLNTSSPRQAWLDYFDNTWTLTELLFASIQDEATFMMQSYHQLRQPLIFYYGHVATLYINKLRVAGLLSEPINPYYEALFETGVDEMVLRPTHSPILPRAPCHCFPSAPTLRPRERSPPHCRLDRACPLPSSHRPLPHPPRRAPCALLRIYRVSQSWDDLSQSSTLWPTVREVHAYRQQVYQTVRSLIERHPGLAEGHDAVLCNSPLWALAMAFEHERIHLETSSVLVRELPQPLLRRPAGWVADHPSVPASDVFEPVAGTHYPLSSMVSVEAATIPLGKSRDWPAFGWDNEYGASSRTIPAFSASSFKVSNGEYLEFVRDGGYRDAAHWTEDGWRWRTFRNAKWPTFWTAVGPSGSHQYRLRTMYDLLPMPWSWPAEVNYHEAKAYANWKAALTGTALRLTTEGEHWRIRDAASVGAMPVGEASMRRLVQADVDRATALDPVMGGKAACDARSLNLNLRYGTPSPVDAAAKEGGAPFGDAMGNVWEWCEDDFHPLEGFTVHSYYDDFSTPCYDGEHNVIMGGSWIATGDEASIWARFHFRPHFFQHAGFRLVAPDDAIAHPTESAGIRVRGADKAGGDADEGYESERLLQAYLNLHFGTPDDILSPGGGGGRAGGGAASYSAALAGALHFPQRCAQLVDSYATKLGSDKGRALDIGCAVGGASFELARTYADVTGVDLSASFVGAAQRLQTEGALPYLRRDQGELRERVVAEVDTSALAGALRFKRADACALPPDMMDFDAVLLANLLDRVPSPKAALGRLGGMRGLVKPGGLAVVVSPHSWLDEHTNRGAWLGGYYTESGKPVYTRDALVAHLADDFELVGEEDLPMLIREHGRKYELLVSEALVFHRKLRVVKGREQ